MTPLLWPDAATSAAQVRLLVLCTLLLGATVVTRGEPTPYLSSDAVTSVYDEPPAYLHPPKAIGFDLSGVPQAAGAMEAALRASARSAADVESRAHTHMSLAVYYKLNGQKGRAAEEKRKGDYWVRVAKIVEGQTNLK